MANSQVDLLLKERALAYTSCGVTLADARDPELPLIFVNPAFEKITGYGTEEVLGKNCRFLQRGDSDQKALGLLRAAIRERRECKVLLRNYRKDGSLFWNELILSPILDDDGRVTHFVGVQTDVTTSRLEQSLRERTVAELQLTNEELDSFAHIVSHDLRAPLRGVEKLCGLLVESHVDGLDAEGRRLVELMRSRLDRMSGLLEGVLRYSRSRIEPEDWKETDTLQVVRDVCELLEIPEGIRLCVSPTLPKIYGDCIRIGQVFQNLIDNAVKFQEGSGSVTIAGEADPEGWHFTVADKGPGIEPEHRQRIFGMFQTAKSRDQLETAGVGLAVVRKAIDRLGGRIWVESEPGEGATFHFVLPEKPPETTKTDASPG